MLTEGNLKQFKKWLKNEYPKDGISIMTYDTFHFIRFEMQIGVILAYYKYIHNMDISVTISTAKNEFERMDKAVNVTIK